MSITFRVGPGFTEGVDWNQFKSASSTTATLTKPTGVVDGVTLRAIVYSSVSAGAVMTPPTGGGWTLELGLTSRRGGIYRKTIPSAAAETATSYVWTAASAGRVDAVLFISTGEDATTPLDIAGAWSTEGTTATAPAVTAAGADLLLEVVYWNNSSATTTTVNVPGTSTKLLDVGSPTTGNTSGIAVAAEQLFTGGSTGTRAFTGTPTPTNMSAVLIGYKAGAPSGDTSLTVTATGTAAGTVTRYGDTAQTVTITATADGTKGGANPDAPLTLTVTPTATGTRIVYADTALTVTATATADASTLVTRFLAAAPTYTAHRGGSADWPEMTLYAYTLAAAWNPNLALEVSCIRTSDGLWMASHDSTTDRVFGVHYDITTTPWSTLQTLRTTVGNQPPALLTDILAAFPNRVFVVDNKLSSFLSPWLDLLDSYGGAARIIVKGYGPQAGDITKADAATARGYKTWGYYYHADTASLASTQSHWSILGEDAVGATPGDATDWAAIKSYGKPVWAHIIATKTQKTFADTFTPTGYMASGVMEVVPQAATGDASLTLTASPTAAGAVVRGGDVSSTVTVSATAAGTRVVLAGAVLTVNPGGAVAGTRIVFGDAQLTIAITPTATAGGGSRDITVDVAGPFRNPLAITGPTRNVLTVSGATT